MIEKFYTETKPLFDNPILVPRNALFGTQNPDDYKRQKKKRVSSGFKEFGPLEYLNQHPISVVALPLETGVLLAILDGHNRVRLSYKFGVLLIPSLIYDIESIAAELRTNPTDLSRIINSNVAEVTQQFNQRMERKGKKPCPRAIARCELSDLKEYLKCESRIYQQARANQ